MYQGYGGDRLSAAVPASSTLRTRRPASPPAVVRRRRLEFELDKAFDTALTLISAGPGFGKTVTVTSWLELRQVDHVFGWLGLDHTDDSPHAFWSDVLAAIRASGVADEGSPLTEISPASTFGAREVDNLLGRLAELRRQLVLVLDDFHLITHPDVLDSVGTLLERLPAQLRLVLIARADPVLPLHRLRVAGRLTEIRTRDLAFNQDEAAELFTLEGLALRPGQVATLWRRTEGWAAGLRLAAMSLDRADPDTGIDRVTGTDRVIAEYLVGEVLDRLARVERDFLLRTSVVDRLCADLADRLTGRDDGQQMLDRLQATNAFVTSLDDNRWFSYHPLLRELLRHQLTLEHRTLVPDLHRRAASWLAQQGQPIESIRYSVKAADWEGAGRTLLACVPRILSVQAPALASAIEPLAERALVEPGLYELIAAAAYHFQRHEYGPMSQDTVDARQYLPTAADDARPTAAVLVDLFDVAAARMSGDAARVVGLCTGVLRTLDDTPRRQVPLARHFRAVATNNLGVGLIWTGDVDAADRALGDAERQLVDLDMELSLVNTNAFQALLDAMVGRCRRAEQRARQVLELIDRRGWGSEAQGHAAHLALGMVFSARGDGERAGRAFGRGLAASATQQTDRSIRVGLAVGSIEAAVLRSDTPAALRTDAGVRAGIVRTPAIAIRLRRWAAVARAEALVADGRATAAVELLGDPADDRGFSTVWHRVWLARACLETGAPHRAEDLLRPVIEPGWQYREPVVFARLLLAIIAERQHRDAVALKYFTLAVELAHVEGIRRPFSLLGDRLVGMLRRYRLLDGEHTPFVVDVLSQFPDELPDPGRLEVENLTERELVVLKYLPTMLKAGEIADDLFVSVNTVKAHLRSMYRKLGVGNRREAVERARALGLL